MADNKEKNPAASSDASGSEVAAPDYGWPEHKVKNPMADKPIVAPDGHVSLSQEDIDSRV